MYLFITRPLPYGRDTIFEYISCIVFWTQYAIIVQKSDIFVSLAEGRIALLRHCLCEMFLSSFRSDSPIVLPTTEVTMKM